MNNFQFERHFICLLVFFMRRLPQGVERKQTLAINESKVKKRNALQLNLPEKRMFSPYFAWQHVISFIRVEVNYVYIFLLF